MQLPRFLNDDLVCRIQDEFGTPVYVYDEDTLRRRADMALGFPNRYGLTVRYAMKALPAAAVLNLFYRLGIVIDASSGYEARRALLAGVAPEHIQITAQQMPENLTDLVSDGVWLNACSLHQLRTFGELFPGADVSVRINPGMGSGHSNRTNVGGPSSSFGIWHEYLNDVLAIAAAHRLKISRMHTHIGSGADPDVWKHCARLALDIAGRLPDVERLSLGGGFKVARTPGETETDLVEVGNAILPDFQRFAETWRRKLHLEIEPGAFLVATAGAVIASVIDVVDTGKSGHNFIKVDTGMTEILRPGMYGAQHPISVVLRSDVSDGQLGEFLVVGHCCESGDILTPAPGDPEGLLTRRLAKPQIGDALVIGATGAYCAGMAAKNYNSFPEAAEVLIGTDGRPVLIRRRQTLDQIIANEVGVRADSAEPLPARD